MEEIGMYVSTTDNIGNREIREVIGLVMSTEISSLRVMLAKEEAGNEYLYDACLKKAQNKLKNNARKLGANAVIGVKTNITTSPELGLMLTLTGTAVMLEYSEEEKKAEEARLAEEAKRAEELRAAELARTAAEARAQAKAEAEAKVASEIKAAAQAKAEAEARAAQEIKAAREAMELAQAKAAEEIKLAEATRAEAQTRAMAEARAILESKVAAERANVEAKAAKEMAAEEAKVKALEDELESALEIANKALEERNQLLMQALSKIESLEKANAALMKQSEPETNKEPEEEYIEENLAGIDEILDGKRKKSDEINEIDVKIVDVIYSYGKPVSASNIQEKVPDMSMMEVLTTLNKLVEQGVIERGDGLYSLVNRASMV
ncbi:MAG: heavy metal-binding domain-containing protein [Lachnospiraceae bacterium]|nr:heavy metal-binding domain-containing protein [Lachnospiraceae bacterium]